jgi:branched-chain amino acid transport system substrate-binding protein
MLNRRTLFAVSAAALAAPRVARAQSTPGVTATEIKIGNIMPYSGPASAYGVIGRLEQVYFRVLNEAGGIAGRKINFITYDDGYSPPKTVEQARRLIEQDRVAFLFNTLGTPTNSAIVRYVNQRKVPHLFLSTAPTSGATTRKRPGPSAGSRATGPRRRST